MEDTFKIKSAYLNLFFTFGFTISLMISPDTLIRLGSFSGDTGVTGFALIILTAFFYIAVFSNISRQLLIIPTPLNNFPLFFYSSVKYIAVVFIATGLLVTSGFVFNEVFLYWFPNFGFAFILLAVLICLQFLPIKLIYYTQLLLISMPIIGLIILIIAGFIQDHPHNISLSFNDIFSIPSWETKTFFLPLLFFIGFDLGLTLPNHPGKNQYLQNKQ